MDGGGYQNTTTVQIMTRLNKIRSQMIKLNTAYNGVSYMDSRAEILKYTEHDVAIRKGPIIMMLTNRGSPEQNASLGLASTGWPRNEAVVDLLTCTEFATGSGGSLSVSYSKLGAGGLPYVMMLVDDAKNLGVCQNHQMGLLSDDEVRRIHAGASPRASLPALGVAAGAAAALSYLV
jgi:alpha-amylase